VKEAPDQVGGFPVYTEDFRAPGSRVDLSAWIFHVGSPTDFALTLLQKRRTRPLTAAFIREI
jgi:hypothetical protein